MEGIWKRSAVANLKRLSAALVLAVFSNGVTVWAQISAPTPISSQTINGVTVKVTQMRWDITPPSDSLSPPINHFKVRYTVSAVPPIAPRPGTKLVDCVKSVTAVDSRGFRIPSSLSRHGTYAIADWNDLDPRLMSVGLDFELLTPGTSVLQSGASGGYITFNDIPLPTRPDINLSVHAEAVTPLGAHVIIETIRIGDDKKTFLTVRVTPPPAAPDLELEFSGLEHLVDNIGDQVRGFGAEDEGLSGDGLRIVSIGDVPNAAARSFTLALKITEQSETLRQEKLFHHFHLRVPLEADKPEPRQVHTPLATAQGDSVLASIDSFGTRYGSYWVRVVLKDRHDPAVTWRVYSLSGKTETGTMLRNVSGTDSFVWKADSTPLTEGENGIELLVNTTGERASFDVPPPQANTLALSADVRASRDDSHHLDFLNLPIPAPGRTLIVNRRMQDASGASLVVRKIAAYSPAHPLPLEVVSSQRPVPMPPAPLGLAVVIAEPSALKGKGGFDPISADVPSGDSLLPTRTRASEAGDALLGSVQAQDDPMRVMTIYLSEPAPGIETFDLRFYRGGVTRLKEREVVTFPAIRVPPASSTP